MPSVTTAIRDARPLGFDDDDDSQEQEEVENITSKREERYLAKAKRAFVPKKFSWPPVETRCVNGSEVNQAWQASGVAIMGMFSYMPIRTGCGTPATDCSYCVADNTERIRRLCKLGNSGTSAAAAVLEVETRFSRRLSPRELSAISHHFGGTTTPDAEQVAACLLNAEKAALAQHTRDEADRFNCIVRSLRDEGERSIRDRRLRAANATKRELAILSAMRADPPPVNVRDTDILGGIYARRSPAHGNPLLASRGWKRSNRMVGIEVEYNQAADLSAWNKRWNGAVHSDGSCGWEAVTTPIAGDRILPCMVELTDTLKKMRVQADGRCSVHVHVDASDVSWACMRRLLHVYAICEPLLYVIGGQHRADSRYAAPCGVAYSEAAKCGDFKEAVLWVAMAGYSSGEKGRAMARHRFGKKDGGRYRGLNIMPWAVGRRVLAPDTTIEFRIHRNCLDGKRIAGWASLLASMVDFAVNSTDAEVNALPKSALRTLVRACPQDKDWVLSRVKAWRKATTAVSSEVVFSDAGSIIPARRISAAKGWSLCVG